MFKETFGVVETSQCMWHLLPLRLRKLIDSGKYLYRIGSVLTEGAAVANRRRPPAWLSNGKGAPNPGRGGGHRNAVT